MSHRPDESEGSAPVQDGALAAIPFWGARFGAVGSVASADGDGASDGCANGGAASDAGVLPNALCHLIGQHPFLPTAPSVSSHSTHSPQYPTYLQHPQYPTYLQCPQSPKIITLCHA
jgi:hypothetical protein